MNSMGIYISTTMTSKTHCSTDSPFNKNNIGASLSRRDVTDTPICKKTSRNCLNKNFTLS